MFKAINKIPIKELSLKKITYNFVRDFNKIN